MEWIQRIATFIVSQIICIPFFKRPFQDLDHPSAYGMKQTLNVRIAVNEKQEIGAWFMQPESKDKSDSDVLEDEKLQYLEDETLIDDGQKVVLYLHGNAETRSQYHRRALYQIFQRMGFYVLAIDYRGYGDSSYLSPSQTSMVQDAKSALEWLDKHSHPNARLYIWGHSLGTGVTSALCSITSESSSTFAKIHGYILEAPFNCMLDEVESFKMSRLLPFFGMDIDKILKLADMSFDNQLNLQSCRSKKILILHAEDDKVINFELGK